MDIRLTHGSAAPSRSHARTRGLMIALLLSLLPAAGKAQNLAAGEPATAFDIQTFAAGVGNATDIAFLPDGRAVIVQRTGAVSIKEGADGDPVLAGRIPLNAGDPEQGLLGVVVDPAFATNKTLYFYASAGPTADAKNRVLKITLGADDQLALASAVILVDRDDARGLPGIEGPRNHNGGGLEIYKNQLYISVGDTGFQTEAIPVNRTGSCLNKPNGKILRVNLDGSVPTDNPLVGVEMVTGCTTYNAPMTATFKPDTRIFAWGLRNPWRFWVDKTTGKLWVGEVGERAFEEISIGTKGTHFGWPFFEGTRGYTNVSTTGCMGMTPPRPCTPPVFEYDQGNRQGASVTGGLIPQGCGWAAPWTSRYVFGDHENRLLWTLDVNAARDGVVAGSRKPFAAGIQPASIRQGVDHALYVVTHNGGAIYRIAPKALAGMNCALAPVPGGDVPMGGTGGANGDGGVDGAGGAGGAGTGGNGAGGSGGGTGGSGVTGTGGASGGTGGSSVGGSGGSTPGTGTGGSNAGAGTGGSSAGGGSSSGGSGCALAGTVPAGLSLSALGVLGVIGLIARRRRARR